MVDKIRIAERALGVNLLSADVAIDESKCIGIKHRKISCTNCVDVCPQQAISMVGKSMLVDKESCVNCGACIQACPTGAIESTLLPWKELFRRAVTSVEATEGRPVFACEKACEELGEADVFLGTEKIVTLPCLGAVGKALLISMIALRCPSIACVHGDCSSCERACGFASFESSLESIAKLLAEIDVDARDRVAVSRSFPEWSLYASSVEDEAVVEAIEESAGSMSRRELFGGLRGKASKATASVLDEVVSTSKLQGIAQSLGILEPDSPLMSASSTRVIGWALGAIVEQLMEDDKDDSIAYKLATTHLKSGIFARPQIDLGKCYGCHLCTTYCPAQALIKEQDGPRVLGFRIEAGLCSKCNACVELCKPRCLKIEDDVLLTDIVLDKPRYQLYD